MRSRAKIAKKRLDVLLVERGLADSRQRAQAVILAGEVFVRGQRQTKAGALVPADAEIQVVSSRLRYASRAGFKLEGALEDFGVSPAGKVCLDIGSSTGGFTDCLLQHGAKRVYAVDVTIHQLAARLQRDPRVVQVKRNARELRQEDLGELVEFVTVDVAFISVTKLLSRLIAVAKPEATFLVLVKPQFELEQKDVGRGGIVRDARLHERAIERVKTAATQAGLSVPDIRASRLAGAEGNREFFVCASVPPGPRAASA